jgi:Zn-dependent M28 family amino/carboxypeptidase
MGAVDDWSGAALLPSLYQNLAGRPHKHTYIFVAFSGEEQGLVGSDWYVKHLAPEELKEITAMVNLECLGLSPTKVWVTHSDKKLVSLLAGTAAALKEPVAEVDVDHVGNDDSDSFRKKKVPNITIHSITQDTFSILHSTRDQVERINPDDYFDSYRLTSAFLAELDTLPATTNAADTGGADKR